MHSKSAIAVPRKMENAFATKCYIKGVTCVCACAWWCYITVPKLTLPTLPPPRQNAESCTITAPASATSPFACW